MGMQVQFTGIKIGDREHIIEDGRLRMEFDLHKRVFIDAMKRVTGKTVTMEYAPARGSLRRCAQWLKERFGITVV